MNQFELIPSGTKLNWDKVEYTEAQEVKETPKNERFLVCSGLVPTLGCFVWFFIQCAIDLASYNHPIRDSIILILGTQIFALWGWKVYKYLWK